MIRRKWNRSATIIRLTQIELEKPIKTHRSSMGTTEYLVRADGIEFWTKHCPRACFQHKNLCVVVCDYIWEGDTVDIMLFIDGQFNEHTTIYSLFTSNQNVENVHVLTNDTISLSFSNKLWSLQISQKPRFILRFLAMFSLGFGFFAMYDQNLTRIRINKRLCLRP